VAVNSIYASIIPSYKYNLVLKSFSYGTQVMGHPVQDLEKINLPCKCRTRGHQLTAGGTERTFRYFGIQNPSESKRLVSRPSFGFWRTPLSQPLLDQSDQSARFYFTPIATPFRYL
jgi:hypothetical protein